MGKCAHEEFAASVGVARLSAEEGGPVTHYSADIKISCARCGLEFEFLGFNTGMSMYEPMASITGTEVHLPIMPPGEKPPAGLPGFRVRSPTAEEMEKERAGGLDN